MSNSLLFSQKEERQRHFMLALRAGIPILILISLIFFTLFLRETPPQMEIKDVIVLLALTFIAIYFIYFLMDLSVKETILDQTTQGFNKRAFIGKLKHHHPTSIAGLYIANFESINENYSSYEVDNLLYAISKLLHLHFKQHNINRVIIGRFQGSEFLIALNEKNYNIEAILEKLITENPTINGIEVDYQVAVVTNTDDDLEKAVEQLRDIISSNKIEDDEDEKEEDKKKSTKVVKKEKTKDAKEFSKIEKCIIDAINEERLKLSFRPLLNANKNKYEMYEIALKLQSDEGDIIPRVFLPVINRLGLGRKYDLILSKKIMQLIPLVDDNIAFTFNLSPFSLRDKSFERLFFENIESNDIDPSRLVIQLYERNTHHNLSGYLNTLKAFRKKGVRICIDNFGASNASMEYMKHFKFDMVQFDRDYVQNLESETTIAMLQSLVTMSKDLNIITIAKWVDNKEQKDKLNSLGVDYLQGFGIGRPFSEKELIKNYN